MNNKLKIYARETKNGKEIDQTQLVSVLSPTNAKTVSSITPKEFYSMVKPKDKSKLKSEKGSQLASVSQSKGQINNKRMPKYASLKMYKFLTSKNNNITNINERMLPVYKSKSKSPLRKIRPKTRNISKEKIEESINNVIDLKDRITQLNNQIDLYEEEHNTIFSLGEESLGELRREKEQLIIELNKSKEESAKYYYKEYTQVKEKQRTNALLRKQIEDYDNKSQCLKEKHNTLISTLEDYYGHSITSLKEFYQQKIKNLDKQIESITLNNSNIISNNNNNSNSLPHTPPLENSNRNEASNNIRATILLLSPNEQREIGLQLKIIFEVKQISQEHLLSQLFNPNTPISIDIIADKIMNLIQSNNERNKETLVCFLETIANETPGEYNNITTMKNIFMQLIGVNEIIVYNRDELNAQLNQLMLFNREMLLKTFKDRDFNTKGLLSIDDFNQIMIQFGYYEKIEAKLHKYILYLMKENMASNWMISDVAYGDLINVLSNTKKDEESMSMSIIIDEQEYLHRIHGYMAKNNVATIEEFLKGISNEIEVYADREYIDNKVFNMFLKQKDIILSNESIPCDKGDKVNLNDITNLKQRHCT